ncbi:MAG: methionine--tRNA ligase [Nanoarchaeota archaeon]
MIKKETFYITTPIYYSNSAPHVGSAYTTLAADIIARWHRLLGKNVFFLTGLDEHGKKIQETAEKAGKNPQQFVDEIAVKFKEAWKKLNIEYDGFIRTTDLYHEKEVKNILTELYKKKIIYKGFYESYYCIGCEQYKTQNDLVEGKCPLHNREPELRKEEAYMLKLSGFQDKILKAIKNNNFLIVPGKRRNEMISFIQQGLQDVSISRRKEDVSWGIELPFDKNHSCYVWVDAFWNYMSGLKTESNKKKFWPPNVQLMANDILRVHSTIWPAILLALGFDLPKKMFIHGYFTFGGQKMSKSLGNILDPIYLSNAYGSDSLRYFLFRNIPFGEDGDFSESALKERHNNELANKLGNLISRVSALAEIYGIEKTEVLDSNQLINKVEKHFDNLELDKALNEIFKFIDHTNEYVQYKKPWETKDKKVLYQLANAIKDIAILLSPFMPETCEKISKVFNFDLSLKVLKKPLKISKVEKSDILFKKIETADNDEKNKENFGNYNTNSPKFSNGQFLKTSNTINRIVHKEKVNKSSKIEGIMSVINFKDWEKIELRVGKIEKAEDIAGADKLYNLTINLGNEKRTICAGLKKHYKRDELKGKMCVVFVNLAPRVMKGIESQGMLLAAVSDDESKVVLLSPEKNIEEGSRVR